MKGIDRRTFFTQFFPVIFAIAFWLFIAFILPYLPRFANSVAPIIPLFMFFVLLDTPFIIFSNTVSYIIGILVILLLMGVLHRFYVKKFPEMGKWEYIFMVIVTYVQMGLLMAIWFLIHLIQLGGMPEQ